MQEQVKGLDGTVLSTLTNVYDDLGRLASSTDWTGTTTYTYFQDGTQKSVQAPNHSAETVTNIDPLTEQPKTITRPDSQSGAGLLAATFGYDVSNTGMLNSLTLTARRGRGGGGTLGPKWAYNVLIIGGGGADNGTYVRMTLRCA